MATALRLALRGTICLAACLSISLASFSQTPGKFGCRYDDSDSGWAELVELKGLVLASISPNAPYLPPKVPGQQFGPFDEERYSFQTIEFFADSVPLLEDRGSLQTDSALLLIVRVSSAKGQEWLKLSLTVDADFDSEEYLELDAAPRTFDRPYAGTIHLATPDSLIPVFQVTFFSHHVGANSSANFAKKLLLDFRAHPPRVMAAIPIRVEGKPDPWKISTSFIERQNLTIRMSVRRFTRLTNAFSKKLTNLKAAVALHFAYYNFCRIHKTLRVAPAMAAGITSNLWNLEQLLAELN